MTKEIVFKCDCDEIEELIREHYGVFYETQAAEESNSNTIKEFDIDGKLDAWELKELDEIIAGKWHGWMTAAFMNKLCQDGYLEAGTYIVNFGW